MNTLTAFGIFTILCIAYIVYRSEYRVHKEYQLEAVKKVNSYIEQIITDDGEDFISFAKLLPDYADEMHIPMEITDYNDSYVEFSDLFTSTHPGESFGKDFFISDLDDEAEFKAKIAITSKDEKQRPWRHTSAAIGVALFDPATDKCIDDTFKRADKLMYEYKKKMKAVRKD